MCLGLGLFLQGFHHTLLGLLGRQARYGLQLLDFLALQVVQLFLLLVNHFQLCLQVGLDGIGLLLLALQLFLALGQHHLALLQLVFRLLDFLVAGGHFLFQVRLLVQEFLLHLQQLVLFHHFGFILSFFQDVLVLGLQSVAEEHVCPHTADDEAGH